MERGHFQDRYPNLPGTEKFLIVFKSRNYEQLMVTQWRIERSFGLTLNNRLRNWKIHRQTG